MLGTVFSPVTDHAGSGLGSEFRGDLMALINEARYGWQVTWREKSGSKVVGRSKVIDDEDEARMFKKLVEDAGDKWPRLSALNEHDLLHLAREYRGSFLQHLLDVVNDEEWSDARKLKTLRHMLEDL